MPIVKSLLHFTKIIHASFVFCLKKALFTMEFQMQRVTLAHWRPDLTWGHIDLSWERRCTKLHKRGEEERDCLKNLMHASSLPFCGIIRSAFVSASSYNCQSNKVGTDITFQNSLTFPSLIKNKTSLTTQIWNVRSTCSSGSEPPLTTVLFTCSVPRKILLRSQSPQMFLPDFNPVYSENQQCYIVLISLRLTFLQNANFPDSK